MKNLPRLKIHNFGALSNVDTEFNKYTLFIGPQGSGKSTIAKLYSLFTWLEKRLKRGMLTIKYVEQYQRFRSSLCAYSRLTDYFHDDSRIEFFGRFYSFIYKDNTLKITPTEETDSGSAMSKVLYVPAERNFLTTIGSPANIKSLPESVSTFLGEFEMARAAYTHGYEIPVGDAVFEYDKLNGISWLRGKDYRIRLSAASSGYQSALSLCLVSRYISDKVENSKRDANELSMAEREVISRQVAAILDMDLSDEVKAAALGQLSNRFSYSEFINIVEEPEQNLYPSSQKDILYYLISIANRLDDNKLVCTTHSPFMINYLTLAAKAWQLRQKVCNKPHLLERIYAVVPENSIINPDFLRIYQLTDGQARLLPLNYGLPSDANLLNLEAGLTNELFGEMLEIEEDIDYGC